MDRSPRPQDKGWTTYEKVVAVVAVLLSVAASQVLNAMTGYALWTPVVWLLPVAAFVVWMRRWRKS